MSDRFDYETAREDLWDMGLDPCELPDKSPERRDAYLRKQNLNPDCYKPSTSRRDSGSGGYGGGGSGTSGYFLTSACVHAKNLPDDCEELESLRNFRDSFLMATEQGRMEVKEYYTVAPKIVAAIDARSDAGAVWKELFSTVITPAVAYIKDGRQEEAHRLYRDCVLRLQEQYVVSN